MIIVIVCDFKIQIIKLHKKYDIKVRKYNDPISFLLPCKRIILTKILFLKLKQSWCDSMTTIKKL